MGEVIGMSIGPQDNIAATAAVTAIRSPFGNEFLAPKTDTPASTFSGLRKNCDAIDKHALASCHSAPPLSSGAQRGTSQWVKRHAIKKARDQLRDPPHLMRLRMTPFALPRRGRFPRFSCQPHTRRSSNLVAFYPLYPFYR